MPLDPIKAEAYRRQLSTLLRGRKLSKEHKEKLRQAKLRKPTRYWLGKKRTPTGEPCIRKKDPELQKKWTENRKIQRQKDLETLAGRPKPENCEVCGKVGRICFDHDHKTAEFRGWLCEQCNVILGYANDNPKILRLLAEYLENLYLKNLPR